MWTYSGREKSDFYNCLNPTATPVICRRERSFCHYSAHPDTVEWERPTGDALFEKCGCSKWTLQKDTKLIEHPAVRRTFPKGQREIVACLRPRRFNQAKPHRGSASSSFAADLYTHVFHSVLWWWLQNANMRMLKRPLKLRGVPIRFN